MKELEDLGKDIELALRLVQSQLGTTMVKIGFDALAMIKKRVIEEGKDAKGQGFPGYSTKPMLVGCKSFKKKSCDKFFGKEKNKELRWATIQRGGNNYRLAYLEEGYKGLREMELGGGHGDKVDFSYTNAMWGDISIISDTGEHDSGTVVIGAKRQEEKDKLTFNTERNLSKGGNEILDLSESEINELKEMFLQPILNVFK
jgi:hypothetical protein